MARRAKAKPLEKQPTDTKLEETVVDDQANADDTAAKTAEEQPPVVDDQANADDTAAKTAEEQPPVVDDQANADGTAAKVEPKKVTPHHLAFFDQYVELAKLGKHDQAIKAYNNCIKSALAKSSPAIYSQILAGFKRSKLVMAPKTILQMASTLAPQDRAVLEIVSVIYRALVFNPNTPLNLELVESVTKSPSFVTWVAKELSKAKAK